MAITISNVLRNKIRGTQLVPGMDAVTFVNDFMVTYERLKELEEHQMHKTEAKSLFLDAIIDPEYKGVKQTLQIDLANRTLKKFIIEVQSICWKSEIGNFRIFVFTYVLHEV